MFVGKETRHCYRSSDTWGKEQCFKTYITAMPLQMIAEIDANAHLLAATLALTTLTGDAPTTTAAKVVCAVGIRHDCVTEVIDELLRKAE